MSFSYKIKRFETVHMICFPDRLDFCSVLRCCSQVFEFGKLQDHIDHGRLKRKTNSDHRSFTKSLTSGKTLRTGERTHGKSSGTSGRKKYPVMVSIIDAATRVTTIETMTIVKRMQFGQQYSLELLF